jgi:predicted phosphoribosyltransferase
MFRDREDAGIQLAEALKHRRLYDPLVLAIPRGGIVVGAVLARQLGAELDVILSRKLRAPDQPELAVGAVSEDGQIYLNDCGRNLVNLTQGYLQTECTHQLAEIARRQRLFRRVRTQAPIAGRSVIVTDDGIATGATMNAALRTLRSRKPREIIVAVPVSSPERLREIEAWCDDVVCLLAPPEFWAVGQFYENFKPVEDEQVVRSLQESSDGMVEESRAHR